MSVTVEYGRFGGRYTEEFDTLDEAASWVEYAEDNGDIFAGYVRRDGRLLFEYEPQPSSRRWKKADPDGPDWPGKNR